MTLATHPASFSMTFATISKTGCRASIPRLSASVADSFSLILPANFWNMERSIPMMAMTGVADNASNPPLSPITPPSVTLSPLSRLSIAPAKFFINPG